MRVFVGKFLSMDTTFNNHFGINTDTSKVTQLQKPLEMCNNEQMDTSVLKETSKTVSNMGNNIMDQIAKQSKVRKQTDEGDFIPSKKPLKTYAARQLAESMSNITGIPTNNKFQILSTASSTDSQSIITEVNSNAHITTTTTAITSPVPSTSNAPSQAKSKKPPPIVLTTKLPNFFADNQRFRAHLQGNLKIVYSNEGIKYLCDSEKDFNKLIDIFKYNKYEYYSYSSEKDRPIRVVIRKLPPTITENEITDELKSLNFSVINVHQWVQNRNSESESYKLPLYLVTLENNLKSKEIFNLNSIQNLVIKIEAYNPQVRLRQCYRCQSFGHVLSGCQREPRCVKCGKNHLITNCPFKGENFTPKCTNCNGDHTANYRECPVYKKHLELFSQRTLSQKQTPRVEPPEKNNKEFPSLPKRQFVRTSQNQERNDTSPIDDLKTIVDLCKNLNLNKIVNLLKTTSQKLKQCNDACSKIFVIIESAMAYFSNEDGCSP